MSGLFRVYLKRKLEYLDHVLNAFRKIFLQLFVQLYSKSISFHMFQFFAETLAKKFIVGDNMNNGVLLWRLINQHSKWGRLYCFITSHNVLANKSVVTYCMHKCSYSESIAFLLNWFYFSHDVEFSALCIVLEYGVK